MTTTWVLVAHRAGARVFSHDGPGKALRLVQDIEHPRGRAQNREIDSDRQGRSYEGGASQTHGLSRNEDPHEHDARVFAGELADVLRRGRVDRRFDHAVLVAEPGFLGTLRGALDDTTAATVTGSLGKDLAHERPEEVAYRLDGLLPV